MSNEWLERERYWARIEWQSTNLCNYLCGRLDWLTGDRDYSRRARIVHLLTLARERDQRRRDKHAAEREELSRQLKARVDAVRH